MDGLNYVVHLFHRGGFVMYPLLVFSLVTVAIAAERFQYYRANQKGAIKFFNTVYELLTHNQWGDAKALCMNTDTAMSRIIYAGLVHEGQPKSMQTAFEAQMSLESIHFRRYMDYLSAIVTLAPLLGLLGTVVGMIGTFSVLDDGGGAMAITGGIGEALVATATGLLVAVLAFCVYTFFSHQMNTHLSDAEKLCLNILHVEAEQGGR